MSNKVVKNKILAEIAKKYLRIGTLKTRNMDRLDFHDIAIWEIVQALEAAYEKGRTENIYEIIDQEQLLKAWNSLTFGFVKLKEEALDNFPETYEEQIEKLRNIASQALSVANYFEKQSLVTCCVCKHECFVNTAHLHQGEYIGDECCWDERLKSSE